MEHKLRMEPRRGDRRHDRIDLKLARNHADDVEWSAEDATRTEPDFLGRCCRGRDQGRRDHDQPARHRRLRDARGHGADVHHVRERVPGVDTVILSTHNHNDLGMAVANTLAAVRAGVRQVESTINGIGERAGNASLEEVSDGDPHPPRCVSYKNNIQTTNILRVSKLLSAITGFDVQPNKAIVGRNAFAHEAGIHQDGVLKNAATYEIMTPESVGWARNQPGDG